MALEKIETATLAGGCFWGVEELFRQMEGVVNTEVGYTGGTTQNPVYETVKTGTTGHAEAIQIEFDANKIGYADILDFFFTIHDPTTEDRQGNDVGSQYRSEIFYHGEQQLTVAEEIVKKWEDSGKWQRPIVTKLSPAQTFYSAEEFHQEYLKKTPGGYTCHYIREF